jgi:hypothetical protein
VLYKEYNLLCYCSNSINFFYYYINIIPCASYQILCEQNVLHSDAICGKSINSCALIFLYRRNSSLTMQRSQFQPISGWKITEVTKIKLVTIIKIHNHKACSMSTIPQIINIKWEVTFAVLNAANWFYFNIIIFYSKHTDMSSTSILLFFIPSSLICLSHLGTSLKTWTLCTIFGHTHHSYYATAIHVSPQNKIIVWTPLQDQVSNVMPLHINLSHDST